ncbi:MAG: GTPase ObgE [Vampirovibrionales bacterium]|nr:GTPase ObgE [Vampirovibrionales bacterium]
MFLDEATIEVQAGAGGNGAIGWRREKYEPMGGPSGGDGGRGGSVYFEASEHLHTLLDFQYQTRFEAPSGEAGSGRNKSFGKGGKDVTIRVPCGTCVTDVVTGRLIGDLLKPGDRMLVAQGGRGGRGNARFSTARNQAPQYAEPGEAGVCRHLKLSLRLIADVGLIGLPNAGKSTLLSVVSAARPKIADYPFTTLVPNLGVVAVHDHRFTMADIPGLIGGAAEGHGLGHAFLKHVERCRLLLHLVELPCLQINSEQDYPPPTQALDALARWQLIQQELAAFSQELAQKPQWIVLTKADSVTSETVQEALTAFEATAPDSRLFVIASVSHQGLEALTSAVTKYLLEHPLAEVSDGLFGDDPDALVKDDSTFDIITLAPGEFRVKGSKIRRWLQVTPMANPSSIRHLMDILKAIGVFEALNKAGANAGDTIWLENSAFSYDPLDASVNP